MTRAALLLAAPAEQLGVHLSSATRIAALALASCFFITIIALVHRRKLSARYTVVWFICGLGLLLLAVVPDLLGTLSEAVGISDTNSMLFVIAILIETVIVLTLTIAVSRQSDQITRLAQEIALLNIKGSEHADDAGKAEGESLPREPESGVSK